MSPGISVSRMCIPFGSGVVPMSAGEIAIRAGNTVGWYDFTDATTLTNDGGGLISEWRDKLLSGNDLTAAAGARPTLGATGITFDGLNTIMKGTFSNAQPVQLYMVFNYPAWVTTKTFFDGSTDITGIIYTTGVDPSFNTGTGFANNTLLLNQFVILRVLFRGATSSSQVNELAKANGDMSSIANLDGITIGGRGGGAWKSAIIVKEIVCRNVADSAPDEAAIYTYLKAKHGL